MLKNKVIYSVLFLLLVTSCSRTTLNMKKNNWNTRTYHNVTSKYNIFFNGNEAFKEGVQKIEDLNVDDYSRVLPVFLDGNHDNYTTAKADMVYAIEKSNKIIQLHSIKKKPKYKPKKASDPEYKAWRNQEEFNKMIDDSYLLMGKANFYQEDFFSAIGIFNFVALKYTGEEAWYRAHIWIARAYIEMGWLYEAENMLLLVNDENLPYKLLKDYNLVSADLNIRREDYKAAVPFLKSALEGHFTKRRKQRLRFILAQIYQLNGDNELAYSYYKQVVRSIPSYEMEFFSRIRMTEVLGDDDVRKAVKKLQKMLRDPKNLEYKGQIYYALANIYVKQNDKSSAIENYRLSLELSEGLQKGLTAKTIGELYYDNKDYQKASRYYSLASANLPEDYPGYYVVSYRDGVLSQLSDYYDIIGDTDRDYRLSKMSESEKNIFLENEKADLALEDKITSSIDKAQGDNEEDLAFVEESSKKVGDWYFFNSNLVESGIRDFSDKWGDRPFRDNWRRSMSSNFDNNEDAFAEDDEEKIENIDSSFIVPQDSVSLLAQDEQLKQIQTSANNKEIVDAYFNLGTLYLFDIEDVTKAIETFDALEEQFPFNLHSPDSYFATYNAAIQIDDKTKAEKAKQDLLRLYPNSNYALILTNPDAKRILNDDKTAYNVLYEKTFDLFLKGYNTKVLANTEQLKTAYRDTSLMSKVLFMEALAIAKTQSSVDIRPRLQQIVDGYPDDIEVVSSASFILKQLGEGKEIPLGGSAANALSERRNETAQLERQRILDTQKYVYDPESRHYLILVITDSLNVNKNYLQFDMARFNFNKFMTMDFDLSFGNLNTETSLMIVNGFANEEEGKWYKKQFLATQILDKYPEIKKDYIISAENFRLLLLLQTMEEYEVFDLKH